MDTAADTFTSTAAAAATAPRSEAPRIVVCGAGIIGAATAFYLAKRGLAPVVVEGTGVAAAASGKAGGFLARGWGAGATVALHEKSFAMHASLAEELGLSSYRRVPTFSTGMGTRRTVETTDAARFDGPSYFDGNLVHFECMDPDTAQVTPVEITTALMDAAVAHGARLVRGRVTGMRFGGDSDGGDGGEGGARVVTGVEVDGGARVLPAAQVLIALGPWSVLAEGWFGIQVPMDGIRSSSMVFSTTPRPLAAHASFCAEDRNDCHLEVVPRPDGSLYLCGLGGSAHLSNAEVAALAPDEVGPDAERVAAAKRSLDNMSTLLRGVDPDITQACIRPCPQDGLPIMGAVPGARNAYISCGHNCWGILWGPICGQAVAELMATGACACVDLAPFSPMRYNRSRASAAARARSRGRKHGEAPVGEQW